ncbi:MAG: Nif3-like dinuclear metal center hexameric protein [Clostridiales bacterium]|nr:Nif3-like dinuclear metal center hexameric protein [Clostridiales bacterium]
MYTVKDIYEWLNRFAPFSSQESWDNSGLIVGDMDAPVECVCLALDMTDDILVRAQSAGAQLIVTHHPAIFNAQKTFTSDSLAYKLAGSGIAHIAVHTPLDAASGGVNDVLALILGLKNIITIPSLNAEGQLIRAGEINPVSPEKFAENVGKALGTHVRYCDGGREIRRVAVCGGSGSDFLEDVIRDRVDAYVTGDFSHHHFLDAVHAGITVVAAGHFSTENPVIPELAEKLKAKFRNLDIKVLSQESPVKFI